MIWFCVFNVNLYNISEILTYCDGQFYWWLKLQYPEKSDQRRTSKRRRRSSSFGSDICSVYLNGTPKVPVQPVRFCLSQVTDKLFSHNAVSSTPHHRQELNSQLLMCKGYLSPHSVTFQQYRDYNWTFSSDAHAVLLRE